MRKKRHQRSKNGILDIYDGIPHSPYLIFIKGLDLSDEEILYQLGLSGYSKLEARIPWSDHLAISRDEEWTHLADSYAYSHWLSNDFRTKIQKMASSFDVFTFSVGDADYSYDFEYWASGERIRKVVWDDPKYDGGFLKEQHGIPLEGEGPVSANKDPLKGLWQLAQSLGIQTDYTQLDTELYSNLTQTKKVSHWFRSLFTGKRS